MKLYHVYSEADKTILLQSRAIIYMCALIHKMTQTMLERQGTHFKFIRPNDTLMNGLEVNILYIDLE